MSPPLPLQQRTALLREARDAVRAAVLRRPDAVRTPLEGALAQPLGCFVTLRRGGELRGCIGTLESEQPLLHNVRSMAEAAALRDPRFPEVAPEELDDLELEVTIVGPTRRIHGPDEVAIGVHGLIVTRGPRRGVLLPQVASDRGWDALTFLEETCHKAGLPRDVWRDPDTILEVFGAEVVE